MTILKVLKCNKQRDNTTTLIVKGDITVLKEGIGILDKNGHPTEILNVRDIKSREKTATIVTFDILDTDVIYV